MVDGAKILIPKITITHHIDNSGIERPLLSHILSIMRLLSYDFMRSYKKIEYLR